MVGNTSILLLIIEVTEVVPRIVLPVVFTDAWKKKDMRKVTKHCKNYSSFDDIVIPHYTIRLLRNLPHITVK